MTSARFLDSMARGYFERNDSIESSVVEYAPFSYNDSIWESNADAFRLHLPLNN